MLKVKTKKTSREIRCQEALDICGLISLGDKISRGCPGCQKYLEMMSRTSRFVCQADKYPKIYTWTPRVASHFEAGNFPKSVSSGFHLLDLFESHNGT